jgi:putative addiction module component (TIGR02574 family)
MMNMSLTGTGHGVPKLEFLMHGKVMSTAIKKVEDDALKLPARSRARLAERLIMSLEEAIDPHAEQAWLDEIERRSTELKGGKLTGIPVRKVLKKARAAVR